MWGLEHTRFLDKKYFLFSLGLGISAAFFAQMLLQLLTPAFNIPLFFLSIEKETYVLQSLRYLLKYITLYVFVGGFIATATLAKYREAGRLLGPAAVYLMLLPLFGLGSAETLPLDVFLLPILSFIIFRAASKVDVRALWKDKPYIVFISSAVFLTLAMSLLLGTVFWISEPVFEKMGIIDFVFSTSWSEENNQFGAGVFIIGTFCVTAVTLCMAVPLSLFTAVYLAEFAHPKVRYVMKSSIELLVGIPSVVYGIFGLFILKDLLRDYVNPVISGTLGEFIPIFHDPGGPGTGVFLASVVLTVMVIPTIIGLAEDAIRSVPRSFREASAALGATEWETIEKIVIPTAMPGIMAGVTLGMTRALGETMAIVMLLGNTYHIPTSIFDAGYAMTSKILNDMSHNLLIDEVRSALFGLAAVLFIIEAALIMFARAIAKRGLKKRNA